MKADFWHEKWAVKSIGFHQADFNPYLLQHWPQLNLDASSTVFVPLCGKSQDIIWLARQGHKVVGVEISELAVREFFVETRLEPSVHSEDGFTCFEADQIKLYCGDYFKLHPSQLEGVTAVYDRAALIALPEPMRRDYVAKLKTLLRANTPVLLVTLEYDEAVLQGPPFSLARDEINDLFDDCAAIELLQTESIEFKDQTCTERSWKILCS